MNYLQLCQQATQECGVASGTAVQTALPTVVGATGSVGRIVNWVADAWIELGLSRDDWEFLRSSGLLGGGVSFPTIAGQASYPLGTGTGTVGLAADLFAAWDVWTFRSYSTASGTSDEVDLEIVGYDEWRDVYMMGANRQVRTRPTVAAIGPDQSICLGPASNGLYTVTADYFAAPVPLVLDADVPALPTRFHMLIVYRAMAKYAGYESAPEVAQRASQEIARMTSQLLAARAPRSAFGGALA